MSQPSGADRVVQGWISGCVRSWRSDARPSIPELLRAARQETGAAELCMCSRSTGLPYPRAPCVRRRHPRSGCPHGSRRSHSGPVRVLLRWPSPSAVALVVVLTCAAQTLIGLESSGQKSSASTVLNEVFRNSQRLVSGGHRTLRPEHTLPAPPPRALGSAGGRQSPGESRDVAQPCALSGRQDEAGHSGTQEAPVGD